MDDQMSFTGRSWDRKHKVTRRERFLAEMEKVIPWHRLEKRIEAHYPKSGGPGRPALGLQKMLRIYFLQQWFDLSDPGAEDALYDSESMRRFAGIELGVDVVPDESTILNFRRLLEEHQLTEAIFEEVKGLLVERGIIIRSGTIVDATVIDAPSSTKNAEQKRDPEMKQGRSNGRDWRFGMKMHVGTDPQGLVHSLAVTPASEADIHQMGCLLHGEEKEVFGDQAYWSDALRQQCEEQGIRYRVNRRCTGKTPLNKRWKRINRARSRVRARAEHPLQVVKHQWGFRKVRYRGLLKNQVRAYALFALANLFLARRRLQP